jgi:hypothetical protein
VFRGPQEPSTRFLVQLEQILIHLASTDREKPIRLKGIKRVDFSNREEFELHVHKCFSKIFETLMKVDATVKQGAEQEEANGNYGVMSELRDDVEEVILHCHLAWQYHRLSRMVPGAASSWDKIDNESKKSEAVAAE